MAGLDSIIKQISEDSAKVCDGIAEAAEKKSASIIDEAKKSNAKYRAEQKKKAEQKAATAIKMAESGAALEKKQMLLSTKVSVIDEIIDEALAEMKALPEKEYFEALYALIAKHGLPEAGRIIISEKDRKRLPSDFLDRVNGERNEKLTLSDEARDIEGGCVLAFGDIEINCTFDALVAESRNDIKDELYKKVFA